MKKIKVLKLMMTLFLVFLMAAPPSILAQSTGETQSPGGTQSAEESKAFKQEELDQILAPIALYPDELLSQVLMASTYPLEVVQAERWAKQNKTLKGDALAQALEKQDWDPSVKSMVNFPDVLTMMSEKLDWTQKLGDAFLAQQKQVMDTVQKLRQKANEAGNLKTTSEQKVVVEKETQTIVIQSASPQVVYVPTYNPTVVYGAWWYPSYPPYYYYPPGYVAGAALLSFGVGVAMGAAWGYAWGGCNWGRGDVDIDVNRNTNINNNIDRSKHQNKVTSGQGGKGEWQHNPEHRKGASYRDQGTAEKFNKASTREATQGRESFRGRSEQGRQDLSKGGAGQLGGQQGGQGRQDLSKGGAGQLGGGQGGQPRAGDRVGGDASSRQSAQQGGREGAFGGGQSGRDVKQQSSRGSSSRSTPPPKTRSGGGGGGGGSRGGGGGGRK
jgi:hypothetical protein